MLSSFKTGQNLGGVLEIESNVDLTVRTIPEEGHGMIKHAIAGYWNSFMAGGCQNHQTFGRNPTWQINLTSAQEVMFRIEVNDVKKTNGNGCAMAALYRVNHVFPVPKNKIPVQSMRNEVLACNKGTYTNQASQWVSEKKKIEPGCYFLVCSTYNPGLEADFNISFFSQGQVQIDKYEHDN